MTTTTLRGPAELAGEFRTDSGARAVYSEAAGIGRIVPRAAAVARGAGDVAALVRWAAAEGVPITPRGSGSSMANGAIGPGVVLDLGALRELHPVDPEARRVRCGAGVLRQSIADAVAEHGLRFPVDPSSGAFCTIGGMIATNAGGAHSLGFGATRAWVEAVDCIFADGSAATLRRGVPPEGESPAAARAADTLARLLAERRTGASQPFRRAVRKDSSGYGVAASLETGDLVDLVVGSEGTLAIVTGVELRLVPTAQASGSLLAAFGDIEATAAAAGEVRAAGAVVCELLERTFLDLARTGGRLDSVPEQAEAVLLVTVEEVGNEELKPRIHELERALRACGAIHVTRAMVPAEAREIWELRHAASPALARLDPNLRSVQVIEDGAVPPGHLGAYLSGVRAALQRHRLRGVIFGHAGDAHVHVNPLVDMRRPDWRPRLEELLLEVTELVAALGGTLTGEHGDGRLRAPLLTKTWSTQAVEAFAAFKRAFDPDGILNPGVKLPLAGQRSIEDVKYDPALDPLSAGVRRVLDHVEGQRAYASSRLRLLEQLG